MRFIVQKFFRDLTQLLVSLCSAYGIAIWGLAYRHGKEIEQNGKNTTRLVLMRYRFADAPSALQAIVFKLSCERRWYFHKIVSVSHNVEAVPHLKPLQNLIARMAFSIHCAVIRRCWKICIQRKI